MASSYVNDLRLNEMATGDASGTWGTVTNTNLELIGEALGFGTEAITTNADTHTSTIADGATDPVRAMFVKYTGTLDSACTITIAPNTLNRMHFIENGTSGSQNIIISQGSGANVTIPPGDTKAVYLDGAGSGAAVIDAFASLSVVDLKVQDDLTVTDDVAIGGLATVGGALTVTGIMKTDNATDATSTTDGSLQTDGGLSVAKDAIIGNDLKLLSDSAVLVFGAGSDATLTHTNDTGLTLNSTNKLMFNDASQFIQGSSATVLSLGATDEIDLTATAIDINGTVDLSSTLAVTGIATFTDDIIIGDGKTIGSASDVDAMTIAANGQVTFTQTLIGTNLDISGNVDIDGTTNLDEVDIDGNVDIQAAIQMGATDNDVRMSLQGNNQYRLVLKNAGNATVLLGSGGANNFRVSDSNGSTMFEMIEAGSIVLPKGGGIHLGVTSAVAANLLSDYEEGTFTADLDASGATIGQSVANGKYTKIGNQVNINIYVQCDGTVSLNGNPLSILGLPFTSVNASGVLQYAAAGMRFVTMASNYDNLMGLVNVNDNKVQVIQHGKGQSPIALPSNGLSNSSGQIFIQMFYYTS